MKFAKFWFTALHPSVFGKVRELVGEIRYAFVGSRPIYWLFVIQKEENSLVHLRSSRKGRIGLGKHIHVP